MTEIERILDQLTRAFEGEAWHGPSLKELLANINSEQAVARPFTSAHSIWEIVLHINTWKDAAQKRLSGQRFEPTINEDWPQVENTSETAWNETRNQLQSSHTILLQTVAQIDDSQLNKVVPGQDYSNYFLLHGLIQHELYHAGQISLLKK